jgi:hypothetical protein
VMMSGHARRASPAQEVVQQQASGGDELQKLSLLRLWQQPAVTMQQRSAATGCLSRVYMLRKELRRQPLVQQAGSQLQCSAAARAAATGSHQGAALCVGDELLLLICCEESCSYCGWWRRRPLNSSSLLLWRKLLWQGCHDMLDDGSEQV